MMTRSISAWQDTVREAADRPDPLLAMLAASFGICTATIPLDDAVGIVEVLRERCSSEVLHDLYYTLGRVLAALEAEMP